MDRLDFKIRKRLEIQPPGARVNSAMAGYRKSKTYIDFPEVGPFEFEKARYFGVFKELKEIKY